MGLTARLTGPLCGDCGDSEYFGLEDGRSPFRGASLYLCCLGCGRANSATDISTMLGPSNGRPAADSGSWPSNEGAGVPGNGWG